MRVLIVDDVQQNCRVMKALLAKHGECDIAATGRDAVTAFQEAWKAGNPYQLICLDIMLPDLDGIKVLAVLRKMEEAMNVEKDKRVCVIMVTSLDDSEYKMKSYDLGISGYLTKPIFSNALTECLKRAKLIE